MLAVLESLWEEDEIAHTTISLLQHGNQCQGAWFSHEIRCCELYVLLIDYHKRGLQHC